MLFAHACLCSVAANDGPKVPTEVQAIRRMALKNLLPGAIAVAATVPGL